MDLQSFVCGWPTLLMAGRSALALVVVVSFFAISTRPWRGADSGLSAAWHDPLGNSLDGEVRPLDEALRFLADHTAPDDLVITNTASEESFWFLSGGRRAALDGASIFQLFDALRAGSQRMRLFAEFLQTADVSLASTYPFTYVFLYKESLCAAPSASYSDLSNFGGGIFPTSLPTFRRSPSFVLAFENASYAIFERRPEPIAENTVASQAPSDDLPLDEPQSTEPPLGKVASVTPTFDRYDVVGTIPAHEGDAPLGVAAYLDGVKIAGGETLCWLKNPGGSSDADGGNAVFRFSIEGKRVADGRDLSKLRFFVGGPDQAAREIAVQR